MKKYLGNGLEYLISILLSMFISMLQDIQQLLLFQQRILKENGKDDYINFLKGGSSKYSIDLLKGAGVDMTTAEPVEKAMEVFSSILDEMENLLTE